MLKYLPSAVSNSVFDINYKALYGYGKKVIIFDLDNTLLSYKETKPTERMINLSNELLSLGFKVYVLTNNHYSRLEEFLKEFKVTGYGNHMMKPSDRRIREFLHKEGINMMCDVVMIGDQLVTDILCANRLGVYSILVKSIDRSSEHFYTKINRLREKKIVRKIAEKDLEFAKKIEKIVNKGDKPWLNA